ncbi:hypothetical protein A5819_003609 [Enterococcus sp. 7E2_DIV0204]|uniref:DUF5592 family protein n=1 Tax=unclassified Enterococcus TaxID=2608891 RepID=UPI000B6C6BF8|nr:MULTISPECIES: DUF5592 family protein [unclassified Enterococcus]OTN84059.1 hypothetical protein A5819_003609 [Enterococcus sp. 7E2_DIV0204]OTP47253.1 hypothetical protein A5884_003628 [Enterococcus sp. 7D2_DIV0200]
MMFDIQKEITTPVKFWGKLLFIDGIGGLVAITYSLDLSQKAYQPFQIPSVIFLLGMYLFWVFPSKGNKGKRHYHRLFYLLFRNKQTYLSEPFISFEQEEVYDESIETEEELELYDVSEVP